VSLPSATEREALRADPFASLEGRGRDAAAARAAAPSLAALLVNAQHTGRDDYRMNKALRRAMRAQRGEAAAAEAERAALGLPGHIPLLPLAPEDVAASQAVAFRRPPPPRSALGDWGDVFAGAGRTQRALGGGFGARAGAASGGGGARPAASAGGRPVGVKRRKA